MADQPPQTTGGGTVALVLKTANLLMTAYGQAAFGLIVFLVVFYVTWGMLVQPVLASNKADLQAVQHTSEALRDVAYGLKDTAVATSNMNITSVKILERMEKLVDRLDETIEKQRK